MQINNQKPFNNRQNLGFSGVKVAPEFKHIEKQIQKQFKSIDIVTSEEKIDILFRPATTSDLPTAHQVSHLGVVDIIDIQGKKLKLGEKPLIFQTKSLQEESPIDILALSLNIFNTLFEKAGWKEQIQSKFGKHI